HCRIASEISSPIEERAGRSARGASCQARRDESLRLPDPAGLRARSDIQPLAFGYRTLERKSPEGGAVDLAGSEDFSPENLSTAATARFPRAGFDQGSDQATGGPMLHHFVASDLSQRWCSHLVSSALKSCC